MNLHKSPGLIRCSVFFVFFQAVNSYFINAQNIRFGIFADPVISWFSSDTRLTENRGTRAGFNFGFTFNKYFSNNYSFSTGLSIMNAGGRISHNDTTLMELSNFNIKVDPAEGIVYRIQYLNIPVGLKFESNQIGYVTFFTDLGLDAKITIGGKVDIPSEHIEGESALKELNRINLGYHINGGIAYSLGGTTEVLLGTGFEQNFLDVTKDLAHQPKDKISHILLKFRIGINF
ncbi:MAG: porin family protein [Bacteroidales bacterium]